MSRTTRRSFVTTMGATGIALGSLPLASAHEIATQIASANTATTATAAVGGIILTAAIKRRLQILRANNAFLKDDSDPGRDAVVRLTASAIDNFLAAYYAANPEFFIRDRKSGNPIYRPTFIDHNVPKAISFYASVLPAINSAALIIDLAPPPAAKAALEEKIAATYPSASLAGAVVPPNVRLTAPNVLLQIDFPKADPNDPTPNQLDVAFTVVADCTMQLIENQDGNRAIKLDQFNITLTANGDVTVVGEPPIPTQCQPAVAPIEDILRDALVLGGNVALTQLGKTLVKNLPLPPIDVISGLPLYPQKLIVDSQGIALQASISAGTLTDQVATGVDFETRLFNDDLATFSASSGLDLNDILFEAAQNASMQMGSTATSTHSAQAHGAMQAYLSRKYPNNPIEKLDRRFQSLNRAPQSKTQGARAGLAMAQQRDLTIEISNQLIDNIAKRLLQANRSDCSPWYHTPKIPVVGFLNGRACYIFQISNPGGGVSGTSLEMHCDFLAGGYVQIQYCQPTPCGDGCTPPLTLGLKLDGPVHFQVTASSQWYDNTALSLSGHFDKTPGFGIIGLPPGVDQIVNMILGFLTGIAVKVFLNALLAVISEVPLIKVHKTVPQTNIAVTVSNFVSSNDGRLLAVGGDLSFAKAG